MVSANRNPEFTRYVLKIHVTIIVYALLLYSNQALQEELKLAKEQVQTSVANHVNSAPPAEVS